MTGSKGIFHQTDLVPPHTSPTLIFFSKITFMLTIFLSLMKLPQISSPNSYLLSFPRLRPIPHSFFISEFKHHSSNIISSLFRLSSSSLSHSHSLFLCISKFKSLHSCIRVQKPLPLSFSLCNKQSVHLHYLRRTKVMWGWMWLEGGIPPI